MLIKEGAEVRVVCTPGALDFVTPLTLATLSKNKVYTHFFVKETGEWTNHVELGKWADIMVLAPLTANTMAKMTHGYCDNLLLATYLSADCPVFFAPAMDLDMYTHPTTTQNIKKLSEYGNIELPAGSGELASGLQGKGRMCEPEDILHYLQIHLSKVKSLQGLRFLVNAGPTYEKIDPVRFIGNYSSGKMGKAIANELASRGASVDLVLGPADTSGISASVRLHRVESADQMYQACTSLFSQVDGAILSAAVADYKPKNTATQKIKKKSDDFTIDLVKNKDILYTLGTLKKTSQRLVGFALETENERENAQVKLEKKNLDFIVLNSMNDKGAGFGKDTNKITIIEKKGKTHTFGTKSKTAVATDIVDLLTTII